MKRNSSKHQTPLLVRFFHDLTVKNKILTMFMLVLLFQLLFELFGQAPNSVYGGSIDTVVRTSSATIFGYFLSSNFVQKDAPPGVAEKPTELPPPPAESQITCDVVKRRCINEEEAGQNQIIIAGLLGGITLLALIIARDIGIPLSEGSPAILSHLRDIISGCIGFLVGSPHNKKGNSSI